MKRKGRLLRWQKPFFIRRVSSFFEKKEAKKLQTSFKKKEAKKLQTSFEKKEAKKLQTSFEKKEAKKLQTRYQKNRPLPRTNPQNQALFVQNPGQIVGRGLAPAV